MKAVDRGAELVSSEFVLANYIHDLNPVIIEFTEAIKLRWYGLAYLAAFVVGFLLLKRLGDKKLWVLPGEMAADFIFATAFFGVFIGGRLGYVLFYHIPERGWGWLTEDPFMPLKVWEGGMASHGGIIGAMIFTFVYMKQKKVSWTGLGDGLCVVTPLGLMFGRIANFINGELYGRVTDASWAMKFPATFWDSALKGAEFDKHHEVKNALLAHDPSLQEGVTKGGGMSSDYFLEKFRENPELREIAGEYLEPRHPSQLYEAFFEGALLFAILFAVRIFFPRLKHGIITGLFFVLYACGRIFCEAFREREEETFAIMSRGQFLSLFMIAIGFAFIIYGCKWEKGNAPKDRDEFDKRKKKA